MIYSKKNSDMTLNGKTNTKILPKHSVDFHDKVYFNIMNIILIYSGRTGTDQERELCI
jgi:hypothetical protein